MLIVCWINDHTPLRLMFYNSEMQVNSIVSVVNLCNETQYKLMKETQMKNKIAPSILSADFLRFDFRHYSVVDFSFCHET